MDRVVWLGLEYSAIELAFRLEPPADLKDAWGAVKVMEGEAIRMRNERANS
jgi:hypothetical protein